MKRTGAALVVLALAAFAAATAVAHRRERDRMDRQARGVRGTGPDGYAGLWRWAEATGRSPLRVEAAAEVPATAVWILAAPDSALGPSAAQAVLGHARAGGLAVWALGSEPQPELEAALALHRRPGEARLAEVSGPLAPHPLFRRLALRSRCEPLESDLPGALPVAGERGCAIALSIPLGRGEVLVLASDDFLANRSIALEDHLAFWARAAGRGPLAFDERAASRPRGHLPLGLVLLLAQGALAAVLLAWAAFPRLGAVRPPPEPGPSPSAGYLRSLAVLYRRARAEPELVRSAYESLRERLWRRAGVPERAPDEEAVRALAALSPEASRALAEAASAERGAGARASDLLRVTRAASDLEVALSAAKRRR